MTTETPPDVLWHYTTTEGLIGIVEKKCIWATDAKYLNDSRELLAGADRFLAQAAAELANPPEGTFGQIYQLFMRPSREAGVQLPEQGPYVTSFCADGDLLSQWRGYASGQGYAIGFSPNALEALAQSRGGRLAQVSYEDRTDGQYGGVLLTLGKPGASWSVSELMLGTRKDDAFEEEQEWRLILCHGDPNEELRTPDVEFRAGALGVIPYVAVAFEPEAIVGVRVGPWGDRDLRERAVRRLLAAGGLGGASVDSSRAPFRS